MSETLNIRFNRSDRKQTKIYVSGDGAEDFTTFFKNVMAPWEEKRKTTSRKRLRHWQRQYFKRVWNSYK